MLCINRIADEQILNLFNMNVKLVCAMLDFQMQLTFEFWIKVKCNVSKCPKCYYNWSILIQRSSWNFLAGSRMVFRQNFDGDSNFIQFVFLVCVLHSIKKQVMRKQNILNIPGVPFRIQVPNVTGIISMKRSIS